MNSAFYLPSGKIATLTDGAAIVAPPTEQCHYRLTVAHQTGAKVVAEAPTMAALLDLNTQMTRLDYHLTALERIEPGGGP